MPAFLALQCYKCSMMQVKQEKKSSNKWNCSVCNEKQSVRKVYARSAAAKDVRKFVQYFNFSRHSAEAEALANAVELAQEPGLSELLNDAGHIDFDMDVSKSLKTSKSAESEARTQNKWAEYLPFEDTELCIDSLEDDVSQDANYVTSFPEISARKRKGRTLAAFNGLEEDSSLHQLQTMAKSSSLTKRKNGSPFDQASRTFSNDIGIIQPHGRKENLPKSALQGRLLSRLSVQAEKSTKVTESHEISPFQVSTKQDSQRGFSEMHTQGTRTTDLGLRSSSKWAEFLSSEDPTLAGADQTGGESSVWSLKSSNNWQYLDGSIKTECDGLLNSEFRAELIDDEIRPHFH